MTRVAIDPHPLLDLGCFETVFSAPLSETPSPDWLVALLADDAPAPVSRHEAIRADVRDLLRHGGYKPTGRGKPASEYLVKAAAAGLRSINVAVDACNAVSLHSGLPISVVDAERLREPLSVGIAGDESYAFNAAGQEIRLAGLLCLRDRDGPSANAVKDSQRSKTHDGTTRTLSLVWGVKRHADHTARTIAWYREILERAGAQTADCDRIDRATPR